AGDAPYLVVANHSSLYDIPALMGAVPGVAIMGREYLTRIPGFGRLLTALHYIPVDTESPRKAHASLERAAEVARNGVSVGMFPEGTRTPDGQVQSLRRGFVQVLRKSGLDLVPARITGTFALKPKGQLTMDPREQIHVRLGAPVRNADLTGLSDREILRRVHTLLQGGEGGPDASL
ncbi:MAG TPA: lysophospholipid acyltransferase family protein, partial [Spirochaetia bacterium]|nr:lysophospholipid acyltransferase family protein [Spirochaetia bacterium]